MNPMTPMLRRSLAALVAVLALVAVAAPAGAQGLDDERSPRIRVEGAKLKASDDIGTADDPAVGKTAPTLKGLSLTGKKITVGNDGKPRIVILLSHACPHCQAEVPRIVELADEGKLDGVEVDTIASNTTQDLPNWPPSEWLEDEDWPYKPVLADDDRLRALTAFGGDAFPYFVFIDADGKIAARASGEVEPSTLTEAATRLAAGQSLFDT